jgi:hypothetical protein
MDYADAAFSRHDDGGPVFGHRVHCSTDHGNIELELSGKQGGNINLGWNYIGGGRDQEKIIKGICWFNDIKILTKYGGDDRAVNKYYPFSAS